MKIAYNPLGSGALPKAPDNKDITFDLVGKVIYALGVPFDGKDTKYTVFKKHTSSDNKGGSEGLVPIPSYSTTNTRLLREDGLWVNITGLIPPDAELSTESTNTVQNKVITNKINEILASIQLKAADVYKNVKVGNTTLVASGINDTLEFKLGNGIIITPNATNKTLEFSINATGNLGINTSYSNNQLVVKILDEYYNKWNAVYNWYISVTEEDTDTLINKWLEIVDFLNSIAEGTNILDEFVTRKTDLTIIGGKTFSKQIISSVAQGTAPFSVASTTVVSKLNADLLDGVHASGLFTNLSNDTNLLSVTIGGTNKKLTIDYANIAGRLEGGSIATWGTLTSANGYTNIATYDYGGTKGAFSFAGKGGQLSLQLDGFFYQNEGRFLVLDTNNYSTHLDNRYYTETEINNKLKEYLPLIGGTMTGPLNFANGTWNSVGDDVAIGDYNAAGMLGLKSLNNDIPGVGFHNKSGTLLGRLQAKGNNLYWNDNLIIHGGNNSLGYIGTTAVQASGAALALTGINSITFTPLTGTNGRAILYQSMGDNDQFRIYCGATASNGGWVEIATADDGTEPIYVRQYTGVFTTLKRTATLLDASGNTSFPGYITSIGFTKSGSSDSYVLLGGGGHKLESNLSVSYAASAGNADTVDGQHFNWNNNKNDHTYLWAASSSGLAYLVHRASMSVNYATYARYVYCTSGSYLNFQWSGQGGLPTWLFGSNDGANVYVWNPSNFSVNYANSAGNATNADTVDNLHASDFVRARGTLGTGNSYDSDWGLSMVTFDPIVSGTAAESNPNVTILNLGNNYNRRKQLWFNYSNNNIYYRRKVDSSWSGWVRLALASEIPTNTWRGITDSYSGTDSTISLSQKGGNALYNALVNGYASSAGSVPWSGVTGKPSFFSGNYNDLTNKPTIPSVGNGTVTIKLAGVSKGSFTMNQSGNTTIELTDNNTTYSFTNNNPTLSWGTKSTIGTVGGVALTVTMPANPNTNTWRSITNSYSGVDTTISLSQKGANDLYKALSGYKSTTASRNTSNTTAGTLLIRQWGPFVNICGRITLKYTNTNTAYVAFTVPSTIGAPVADVGFHITYYGTGSDDDRGCLLYASAGSRTFYFTYNELNNTPSVYINICYFTETSTFTLTKI